MAQKKPLKMPSVMLINATADPSGAIKLSVSGSSALARFNTPPFVIIGWSNDTTSSPPANPM